MFHHRLKLPVAGLWAISLTLALPSVRACSVPVFRYALERWPADLFEVVVFHRGDLNAEAKAALEMLDKSAVTGQGYGNYNLRAVDLDSAPDPGLLKLWKTQEGAKPPWMVVLYPARWGLPSAAWSGPLSTASTAAALDSPLRRQIAQRLVKGDVAVWVLLESGDSKKDDAAASLLQGMIDDLCKNLKLPSPFFADEDAEDDFAGSDLQVSFGLLRVSRSEPKEQPFVSMLLNTEDDLRTFSEPIAFAVFGRGRILYALVGKGINKDTIAETCMFLAGPCSCQAKAQNPGVDMLMCIDWDAAIMGQLVSAAETPPLTSLPSLPSQAASVTKHAKPVHEAEVPQAPSALVRNALLAVAAGLAILAAAALWLGRGYKRG